MSAEQVLQPAEGSFTLDPRARHVLRYALGATLAMALAMAGGWPLSYLVPVLCLTLLAAPKAPTFRQGTMLLVTLALALVGGLWTIKYLLGSQFLFFTGIGLILFRVFYAQCSGAPTIVILWLLIALLVLPMVAIQSPQIAALIAQSLFFSAAASLVVTWVVHGLIPETRDASASAKPAAPRPPRAERVRQALERMVVVFPLFILFHLFEWSGALLVLIFVALLSIQPGFAENFKGGIAMILGNAIGGLAAIAAFNLLTVVPELVFLLGLCLLGGLFFGNRLLGGGKFAPLFGMAFSTMLLLLGSTTSGEGEAGSAAWSRIFQIMVAVVYVVTAFGILRRWRTARSS
jgi:hypothetical protein